MSSSTQVRIAIDGPRASLTFTTEGGLNVLSREVLIRLANGIETIASDTQIRFTVVRAEGKVFVAGADIKEMSSFDSAQAKEFSIFGNRVMDSLEALPSITVAALQGAALGGGCELALACDFRLAVGTAKIGLPETSLGLIPGWGGTKRSLRLLGPVHAKRLVFGALPLSAAEAVHIGLVDQVVADGVTMDATVENFCKSLLRGSSQAIAQAKRAFLSGDESSAFGACFDHAQSREGITAFNEKRQASWMEELS